MKKLMTLCAVLSATSVVADTKEAAPPIIDMTKMGPAARKVTDEKKTKKELEAFFKAVDEADKTGNFDAAVAAIDFPLFMATDDLKGVPESQAYSKAQYIAMMKPMMEGMPKDLVTTHKRSVTVLSDSLANVVDDWTTSLGKVKTTGKNATLVVKVGADWKLKSMVEAGWGDVPEPAPVPADSKTTTAAPAAKSAPAVAPAKK
jgi:hypothetical protein